MWVLPTKNALADINDLLDTFLQTGKSYLSTETGIVFYSQKTKDGYELMAKVPGFSKGSIKISSDNETLSIKGKRVTTGETEIKKRWLEEEFEKTVSLPNDVNVEGINAKLEDGVLLILLPIKVETKAKTVSIL